MPAFSLRFAPRHLTVTASQLKQTLPYRQLANELTHNFGAMLSPVELSAQNHSTSELLRTL